MNRVLRNLFKSQVSPPVSKCVRIIMDRNVHFLYISLLTFLSIFKLSSGSGIISVKFVSFNNRYGRGSNGNCCDGRWGICPSPCDHFFVICLDRGDGGNNINVCPYGRIRTRETKNKNYIDFTNTVGGVSNPMLFTFDSWPGSMKMKFDVWDKDDSSGHDFVTFLSGTVSRTPAASLALASTYGLWLGYNNRLHLEVKVYCSDYYYGDKCIKYCKPADDWTGHYRCLSNGSKECLQGWTGDMCDVKISECRSQPCFNGATCIDKAKGYGCVCPPGYTGVVCDREINECESNPCSNGAACGDLLNGYNCTCAAGWTGPTCFESINDCENHGCLNNASCIDDHLNYRCICRDGFSGRFCETNVDECVSNPCRHGGNCTDLIYDFSCSCSAGWKGATCEENINDCESNPCENGATCADEHLDFSCLCKAGYTGKKCEQNIDECASNPCEHNGACVDGINGFICSCSEGWTGIRCEVNINECSFNPCTKNGTCVDGIANYTCICYSGFTGRHCEVEIYECLSNPCLNNGTCNDRINGFTCSCSEGWTGEMCETDIHECGSSPCLNGGTCIDGINKIDCTCAIGWTGQFCETQIDECESNPCAHNGTCIDEIGRFECVCPGGWLGVTCVEEDKCFNQPCKNNATCINSKPLYTCECLLGWVGPNCEQLDRCEPNPCDNGGQCKNTVAGHDCACTRKWTGRNCEIPVSKATSGQLTIYLDGKVNKKNEYLLKESLRKIFTQYLIKPLSKNIVIKLEYEYFKGDMGQVVTQTLISVTEFGDNLKTSQLKSSWDQTDVAKLDANLPFPLYIGQVRPHAAASSQDTTVDFHTHSWIETNWYIILGATVAVLACALVITVVVLRRKRRKQEQHGTIMFDNVIANNCSMSEDQPIESFDNALYMANPIVLGLNTGESNS